MRKSIPVGIGDFKKIIEEEYLFIDKSLLIKDIIEDGAEAILLPRPRRFGKTLNMSMLKYFFNKTYEDNSFLFNKLEISKYPEIMKHMGKYPVIFITFKDLKYGSWEKCFEALKLIISDIFDAHKEILDGEKVSKFQKDKYIKILEGEFSFVEGCNALALLSEVLHEFYNEPVILLIDEYDVPIQSGYTNGYYNEVIEFMRSFLSGGLKDNLHLKKAVLTGILRVAKESIFSGLNNLKVCSILRPQYSKFFGFIHKEVIDILKQYDILDKIDGVKDWYNGYKFGDSTVYNPWSILNFIDSHDRGFMPHWVNTSSNNIVKVLLAKGSEDIKKDLEELIKDNYITKTIDENIIMEDIQKDSESVWSFLLLSGYLKVEELKLEAGDTICKMRVPNKEVKYLYEHIIVSWFKENISRDKYKQMIDCLVSGEIEIFEDILKDFLLKSASYFDIGDESEKFYHALVLGMLVSLNEEYRVKSNRESGYGRYDIMLIPKDNRKYGIVIEFKRVKSRQNETLEDAAKKALNQIKEKNYKQELLDLGIKNILELGIAFKGKEVIVKEN